MSMSVEKQEQVLSAFKELATGRPLVAVSQAEIAEHAGLSIKDLRVAYPARMDLVDLYIKDVNETVLKTYDLEEDESKRDRLFDLLMTYFEQLKKDRDFVLKVERYIQQNPCHFIRQRPLISKLFKRFLISCEIKDKGLTGRVRAKGLEAIFWATYKVWRKDETDDLAKTMAALDKYLRQTDALLSRVCRPLKGAKNG